MLGLNYIKELFSNLLFRGDNYLVIEILNHYIQATVIKANLKDKKIRIIRNLIAPVGELSPPVVLFELKQLLKKIGKIEKYGIILSLDSCFSSTTYASASLVRQHPKDAVDEADLDNLISQAIWRFFDKNRYKVAQKLNIDEVDVLLSNVQIRGIKIDGHKIVNPMGFKAKTVEVFFSQTLVGREFMGGLRDLIPKEKIALITEAGTAMSHIMSRALGKEDFFVANLFPNHTAFFSSSSGRLAHHDNFDWGEKNINGSLVGHFCVDTDVAGLIMQKYAANCASQNFTRRFENVLGKELQIFANGLESLIDDDSADIYLNPFFTAPPILFSDRFQNRLSKSFKLSALSTNIITEKLGFEIQCNESVEVKNLFSLLSAFLEINFLPQNDKMSHLANRRVRWLVA